MNEKKFKILVAEDEKFLATALADKLEREGFEVLRAPNGVEAVAIARSRAPDLILLDLIMPLKNGFQVLEELRAEPRLAAVPVMVLSNLGQENDMAKAKALGAVDYLVKSDLELKTVVNRIKKLLAPSPAGS